MPPVASPETTCWTKISIGSVSEVRASDGVVPAELGRRPRHDDAARLEEVGVIGEVERRRDVLLDEQDAHALLAVDGAHDAEDLAGDERRESERGLVEEEQARPEHERAPRSEEHTSELQSPCNLVCRLLLEKKNRKITGRLPRSGFSQGRILSA